MIKNLSIICPTLNERDNVAVIYQHIDRIVTCDWELIFVDDNSSDGTRLEIERLSRQDRRVRLINRVGRKGLASAASEGFLCAVYDYCVLIDADLQHDINNINVMAGEMAESDIDLVISSRFKVNQTLGLSSGRARLSRVGNGMIDLILRRQLTDPLSGCFLIRRERYLALHQSLILSGFKILFDILSCPDGRQLRVKEIPIKFLSRHSGESKLRKTVMLEFMTTYLTRMVERVIPLSFIKFSIIGALGVLLHYLILSFFLKLSGFDFAVSQLVTSYLVMVSNFLLNNRYTFSANRLFGGQLVFGLMKFMFFCSFGALISLSFAFYLKDTGLSPVAAGVLGTVAGSLWNFVLNSLYTWRGHGK